MPIAAIARRAITIFDNYHKVPIHNRQKETNFAHGLLEGYGTGSYHTPTWPVVYDIQIVFQYNGINSQSFYGISHPMGWRSGSLGYDPVSGHFIRTAFGQNQGGQHLIRTHLGAVCGHPVRLLLL